MTTEHDEQKKVFEWARYNTGRYPELRLLYAIPNAGKRSLKMGAYMKAEGLKAGMPDMCLPVGHGGYTSLYIELKHGKNKPTASQVKFLDLLHQYGNLAVVAYEFEGAKEVILEYINQPRVPTWRK